MADSKEGPTKVTMSSNAPSDDGAEVKDHSMGRFSSIECVPPNSASVLPKYVLTCVLSMMDTETMCGRLPYSATSPEQSAKT
ncbi:hypothetical protein LTR56_018818 [Elasticomyces elasticus]|nr:hypothetical protein LTR22_024581 [Elasticomyces elasticus]KAK3628081.1 hypothetical protein LTR56_018818 [Elasticomyces elasticus]KAK5742754.1 hypothetical protein LTS12_024121 [Elasticomyces elasticus]